MTVMHTGVKQTSYILKYARLITITWSKRNSITLILKCALQTANVILVQIMLFNKLGLIVIEIRFINLDELPLLNEKWQPMVATLLNSCGMIQLNFLMRFSRIV